jgi:hypothetical protein
MRIPENFANLAAMNEGLFPLIGNIHNKIMSKMKYHQKHRAGIAKNPNQRINSTD